MIKCSFHILGIFRRKNEDGEDDDSCTRNESRKYFSPRYNHVLSTSTLDDGAFGYIDDIYIVLFKYVCIFI